MEFSWLVLLVSISVFIATVLLAVSCLDCRNKGPPVSIMQTASEEYMPSTDFRVIHPSLPPADLNSIHSPSHLLSPFPNLALPGTQRRQVSYTTTDTESNPSYENPGIGPESLESDAEEPGYIIVLPEGELSRASTPSSDVRHDYENVENPSSETPDDLNPDYLNVEPMHNQPGSTSDSSDSSDDEGNYVNQPPLIHS